MICYHRRWSCCQDQTQVQAIEDKYQFLKMEMQSGREGAIWNMNCAVKFEEERNEDKKTV